MTRWCCFVGEWANRQLSIGTRWKTGSKAVVPSMNDSDAAPIRVIVRTDGHRPDISMYISEQEVRVVLTYEALIPAIRQALLDFSAGRVIPPPRTILGAGNADDR